MAKEYLPATIGERLRDSANTGLIISTSEAAFRHCGSPKFIDKNDSEQEAALSFLVSAPRYEKSKGIKFSTYIYECIFNHTVDYISKSCHRFSNDKPIYSVEECDENYCNSNILTQDFWQEKLEMFSLSAEQIFFMNYFKETIKNAVEKLNPRQKKFISFRYGLGKNEYEISHTFVEAAKQFGITKSEAYSIEQGAFLSMRKFISERLSGEIFSEKENNIYDFIFKTGKIDEDEIEDETI